MSTWHWPWASNPRSGRPGGHLKLFSGGIDQRHKHEWRTFFAEQGERSAWAGPAQAPDPVSRRARHAGPPPHDHPRHHGRTPGDHRSKNHGNAVHNPRAQYRFEVPVAAALPTRAWWNRSPARCAVHFPMVPRPSWPVPTPSWPGAPPRRSTVQFRCGPACWWAAPGATSKTTRWPTPPIVRMTARASPTTSTSLKCTMPPVIATCRPPSPLGFCARGAGVPTWPPEPRRAMALARSTPWRTGLEGHPLGATGLGMIDDLFDNRGERPATSRCRRCSHRPATKRRRSHRPR